MDEIKGLYIPLVDSLSYAFKLSKSDVRRLIQQGGFYYWIDGWEKITNVGLNCTFEGIYKKGSHTIKKIKCVA
jgi:hypothetical protein